MSSNLLFIAIVVGAALVGLLAIGFILTRLFRRASKELAFVRTGFGGEKVILDGGAFFISALHKIMEVNMQTLKLSVKRENEDALITKDRMRVDVEVDFYLRVKRDIESVATAAQTLGERTKSPERLRELMEGKFIDALRAVAASMTMESLHEQRADFVQEVQKNVVEDLVKNGLELESVSLTSFDQTSMEHFNANNAFDAQGLTKLTETIEEKKKVRNEIAQDNSVSIERKNLQAHKEKLSIKQEEEFATATQMREVEVQKSTEMTEASKRTAELKRQSQEAEITAQQDVDQRRIRAEKAVEEEKIINNQELETARILKEKAVEIANQERDIEVSNKSKEKSQADKEANEARAEAVGAEEKVITARETEVANRKKSIAVIKATEEAEEKAVGVKVAAEATKIAAADEAEAIKTKAIAEAEAIKIAAEAKLKDYEAEAIGKEKLNEADNKLSPEIIRMNIQIETIRNAADIIAASVEPIKSIDGMKVINVGGLGTIVGNGNGSSNGNNGEGFADQLLGSLLKYRAQAPIVDKILKEINIDLNSAEGLTKSLQDIASVQSEDAVEEEIK